MNGIKQKKTNIRYVIIILSILLSVLIVFLYINREELHERYQTRKLLSVVSQNYSKYVKLDYIILDEQAKQFKCIYKAKYSSLGNGANQISKIRKEIELFLSENDEYFLHDNYEIIFIFRTIADEHIIFSNRSPYDSAGLLPANQLRHVDLAVSYNISSLTEYFDVHSLRTSQLIYDNLEVIKNYTYLNYISSLHGFQTSEIEYINSTLPECQIVPYSLAKTYW